MADPTAVATNATVLTAFTGLAGIIVAGYFGYKAKERERQLDGHSSVEVKRLDNAAFTETHLWEALKQRDETIKALGEQLSEKIDRLAKCEARIVLLEGWREEETPEPHFEKRVLLVDDYSDMLNMVVIMLRDEPYELQTTGSGRTALSLYEQAIKTGHPFDLLVLDIRMPDLDGIDVARAIRTQGDQTTRIIWLTANPEMSKERDAAGVVVRDYTTEFGVLDTIVKPCSPGDLQAKIRAALTARTP